MRGGVHHSVSGVQEAQDNLKLFTAYTQQHTRLRNESALNSNPRRKQLVDVGRLV